MTTIRYMVPEDAEAVSALLHESWRRTYSPLMGEKKAVEASAAFHDIEKLAAEADNEDNVIFVAEDEDGHIVGHAMASMDEDHRAWLRRLYIAPEKFGSGLAVDLLHAILAAHSGLPFIALEVAAGNDRAIAFYRKHGFLDAGHKADCSGIDGVPALIMTKILPRA